MAGLYLDHGVAVAITPVLVSAGHDVLTARDLRLRSAGDDLHLLTATHLGRILVSYDIDFRVLHHAWRRWSADWGVSRQHSGILLIPQPPVCPATRGAQALLDILARGIVVTNELWQWTERDGWQQFPNP